MSEVGVFVIGVARSGTSATARLVGACGVNLPAEEHLKQPEEANPIGFYEVTHLTKVNHWIMEGFGGHSMAPPLLPEGWLDEPWIAELGIGARELFEDVFDESPWVWKHPTTSVVLPFWLRSLDVKPVIVVTVRHPLENAASIRAFRGNETMSSRCSLAIWERYLRSALAYSAGCPTFVAGYSELIARPESVVRDLGAFLAAHGATEDGTVRPDLLGDLVRPDLRHHAADHDQTSDERSELSEAQQRLWRMTREMIGPHDSFPAVDLGEETDWNAAILEERNGYEWTREEFRDREKALRRNLKRAERERARALKRAETLESDRAKAREKLEANLAKAREKNDKLGEELAESREARTALKQKLTRSREVEHESTAKAEALAAEVERLKAGAPEPAGTLEP